MRGWLAWQGMAWHGRGVKKRAVRVGCGVAACKKATAGGGAWGTASDAPRRQGAAASSRGAAGRPSGNSSAAHLTTRFSAAMAPAEGQPCGGRLLGSTAGASSSYWLYSIIRSTLFMLTSRSVDWRTIQFMMPVRLRALVSARPARPAFCGK